MHLAKHFRRGCLVDASLISQASTPDCLQKVQRTLHAGIISAVGRLKCNCVAE